jgi:hypothetical protein
MTVHTFLITMNDERKRHTLDELEKININPEIIAGVDGRINRNDENLTTFCKKMCTDRIIGCALAHRNVMKKLVKDDHDFALVVEDDIIVLSPDTFDTDIKHVLKTYKNKEWDFISLFCQGLCSDKLSNRVFNGSTAAYLISKQGAKKMLDSKIAYHADFIRQNLTMNSFLGPQLFDTLDPKNTMLIGKQEPKFWLNQDALQFGNFRAQFSHMFSVWIIIVCVIVALRHKVSPCVKLNIISFLVMFPSLIIHYMTYETQYYRCSKLTHVFGLIFPISVILGQEFIDSALVKNIVVPLAHGMLMFNLLYEVDK